MKKLLLTSVCVLAVASGAFAQGKVNWNSISASFFTAQTNSQSYSPLFGGGSTGSGTVGGTINPSSPAGAAYYCELLYSAFSGSQVAQPSTLSGLAAWSDTGLSGTNNPTTASRFVSVNPGTSVNVPWANGTTQSVMLVIWSANLGTTWSSALATLQSSSLLAAVVGQSFLGTSATGYINPGTADPGVSVFGSSDIGSGLPIKSLLTQVYLVPTVTPEPATMVLAGLGGLSLLAFRRKK